MITYIAGFFLIAWFPFLPSFSWLLSFPIVWLVIMRCVPSIRYPLLTFVIGSVIALIYGHSQLLHRWSVDEASTVWKVTGVVEGLPEKRGKQMHFNFQVTGMQDEHAIEALNKPRIIRLSWYSTDRQIKPGDRLVMGVKIRPPHSLWNPGGFDYELWALSRNIDAIGYVKHLFEQKKAVSESVDLIRFRIIAWLAKRFDSQPAVLSSLQALLLGDKSALQDWQWTLMRNTGTTHLMVVSGLHIGVCVALGWWLGRFLCICLFRGKEHYIFHSWLPVLTALLTSGLYVALAGFSIPTQRAWIMAAVLLGAQLLKRRPDVWTRWWLAMAVVLTLQPLAVHEIGFWLSFSAVGALLFLVTVRQAKGSLLIFLRSQGWIFLVLSPLLLLFFGQVSLSSPLVNILAIPFLSLLLVLTLPALVMEMVGVHWGLDVVSMLIQWLWNGLAWVDALSDQWVLDFQPPGVIAIVFALLGAVMILQPVSVRLKIAGALCWLPVFMPSNDAVPFQQMKVIVFDVGQGTAVLIRTRQHSLLYDTGAAYFNGSTAVERAVLPYFRQQNISFLDKLVISHDDNDHAGGAGKVVRVLTIGATESGMPDALNIPAESCTPGMKWQWDGVEFRYIHPEASINTTDNDRSCVLEVRSPQCSLLLTGDASLKVEAKLLDTLRPVNWLVAGHHGSRTSTGTSLLDVVKPDNVLISAGFLNRYGHPHKEVLWRIEEQGGKVVRTDRQGAILLDESAESACRVQTWRQIEKRYWSAS